MRYLFTSLVFALAVPALCFAAEKTCTYGDYSHWCSAYGICKEDIGQKDAEKAIKRYFSSRGLNASNMRHRGRFVEVEIYKDEKLYDKVLFDRKTGRLRSIY